MPAPYLPEPIAGVYGILCSKTQRRYIGQSGNIVNRWNSELNQLSIGKHHNKALQADYDAHGPLHFSMTMLEFPIADQAERHRREHYWLQRQLQRGKQVYNANLDVDDGKDWAAPKEDNPTADPPDLDAEDSFSEELNH